MVKSTWAKITMPLHSDDPGSGWIALSLTAIVGAIGLAYRSWFGVRRDVRDDRKGESVNGTYESVLKMLREQLKEEIDRRVRAEARIMELEAKLRAMTRPPDFIL